RSLIIRDKNKILLDIGGCVCSFTRTDRFLLRSRFLLCLRNAKQLCCACATLKRSSAVQGDEENCMGVRENQKNMTSAEWSAFIAAVDAMHGTGAAAPAYRRFVTLHVDAMRMSHMDWSVHTMRMLDGSFMRGRNFLAWHRRLVKIFEGRLGV